MVSSEDISVVVPIYNGVDKLQQIVGCYLAQTEKPLELILVDDGSTDGLEDAVMQYTSLPWLSYVRKDNGGPASARNKGLGLARGKYVAFLDSDDIWFPGKIELQVKAINGHKGKRTLGLIDTFIKAEYPDGKLRYAKRSNNGDMLERMLYQNCVNGTSSVIVDRSVALECGGFSEKLWFGEDRMLWTKIAERCDFVTVPEVLVKKINRSDNLTSRSSQNYDHIVCYINLIVNEYGNKTNREKIFFVNTKFIFRKLIKDRNREGLLKCLSDSLGVSFWRTVFSLRPAALVWVSCFPGKHKASKSGQRRAA